MTDFVRAIHNGEDGYGLIIKPAGDTETGFDEDLEPVFAVLGDLKVRVLYRGRDRHRGPRER